MGMNKVGNVASLVASHPGNVNAVKHGAYSGRLMQERAAELIVGLVGSCTLSPSEQVAVGEVAQLMATLEAIDRDLDERGLVDKKGESRSILNHRARISRQLDRWLERVANTIDRQSAPSRMGLASEEDLRGALEWIALGHDRTATAHDRLLALTALSKLLPKVELPQSFTIPVFTGPDGGLIYRDYEIDPDVDMDSVW